MKNRLYYGDNLEILRNREYFPDECVDLIYLDPPFNSNRNYNVLFKAESGADSEAQITAFEDTWHWGETAEETYRDLIVDAPEKVSTAIEALLNLIDRNQMMAYLVMMTARLVELRRVLKPTGSLYLHCDPTASHYLKIVLDAIFGPAQFRNEVVWKRTSAHDLSSKQWSAIHDIILMYSRSSEWCWNVNYMEYDEEYIRTGFRYQDEKGNYSADAITGGKAGGPEAYEPWRDREPSRGRAWALPGYNRFPEWLKVDLPPENQWNGLSIHAKLDVLDSLGMIHWPAKENGQPRLKRYLADARGQIAGDLWTDVKPISSHAKERLGYPTQKPEALLERIIRASSNESDIVLDPFCGCGTAIAAAHKLGRKWIGIDITHLSIALQKYRLLDMFELESGEDYEVIGEPTTEEGARELAQDSANEGRYQFEWWALSLVGAKPVGGQAGSRRGVKGADKGIDGVINFFEQDDKGKPKPRKVIAQVKSGKVSAKEIRDLNWTVEREKAAIGVFITLENPTRPMLKEALAAGWYESPLWQKPYRKLQILTISDLLGGAGVDMPSPHGTFKQAARVRSTDGAAQRDLM
ncbi:MAG: DNA methyltransferase [Chloroflexota bacterium]|nr:DNA methyltransferase [Chloroflexota bacterium]MDE2945542.1 DNA methyltransferase [Chloroflexota bacterium]